MSIGGFYLSQFKITYNTTNYNSLYDYGCDLLSKYANCIINASQRSDGNWSIDSDKTAEADDTVNGVPIYDIQTRIPVWGSAYPTGSYNIGCFLKYDNGTTVRHLFLMLNSCAIYFSGTAGSSTYTKDSLPFYRVTETVLSGSNNHITTTTLNPISFGALCRNQPFNVNDLFNNSLSTFSVSDTVFFTLTGSGIYSYFSSTMNNRNISFYAKKLSTPNENDSYVLGVCVKNDIIISIFRDSSWGIGNYTCSIFGNIIDCYNSFDNKSFGILIGSGFRYNQWRITVNNNLTNVYEDYNNESINLVAGFSKQSNNMIGMNEDYLTSVLSHTTDLTNFCGYTTGYLSFIDNIANNSNGSKFKGKINTDVYRRCTDLVSSEVVLDGNFLRIGCCLVGWDYTNENLLD